MSFDISALPKEAKKALEQFQEFEILEFNDSGANGYVMIGKHKILNKNVAIKIYFHDENEIDQEPAIIASIEHENVLKVYDARKVEKTCSFYMMQAANDGDLYNFLTRYNVSTNMAHSLTCQLLSGLSALHYEKKGLVHRDLKPENLLVHDDTIVIADFGSVRQVNKTTGVAPASKHSILYRPPEAFGEKDSFFDFSSDVYQAGIIGYLLFGGTLSNDLLTYLTPREIKALDTVKTEGTDYEISVFIDSCIEKKIKAGKLLDWNSLPFYTPKNIRRILKKAVSDHKIRFKNSSEFLAELSKAKSNSPDWITSSEGHTLRDWKGNDYILNERDGVVTLSKKKHSSSKYRLDNSLQSTTLLDAYEKLKKYINLPN